MKIYKSNKFFDSECFENLKQFKETAYEYLEFYIIESNTKMNYGFIVDKSKKQFLSCNIQGELDGLEKEIVKVYVGDDFLKATFNLYVKIDDDSIKESILFDKIQIKDNQNDTEYIGTFEHFYNNFIQNKVQ